MYARISMYFVNFVINVDYFKWNSISTSWVFSNLLDVIWMFFRDKKFESLKSEWFTKKQMPRRWSCICKQFQKEKDSIAILKNYIVAREQLVTN